ncbi:hypothetical protein B484DRAFT_455491 [Ochromonadaceae sp. CCMP2298]|nr:hypothetical protein B484DRAFT_455491 [Ochromonadaceae sp. CCMP2298]
MQLCVGSDRSYIPDCLLDGLGTTPMSSISITPSTSQSSESQSSESQGSQYSGISMFSPHSRNGRHIHFYKMPKSISAEQSKENFLRNVPQAVFEAMLADAGGSVGQGVELFVERMYKIDAGAAVAGVRSGGGACFQRFGAEETVALQRLLGISGAKRKLLASIMKSRWRSGTALPALSSS